MNPWLINPPWQHFSSMFREAVATREEKSEFLRNHHYAATLYFGISFVEAFLNGKRRSVLKTQGTAEEEIYKILRSGGFDDKVKKWPSLICGKEVKVSESLVNILSEFNLIRGNLTHPKSSGHDIYKKLESLDVDDFVNSVAEYSVTIATGLNERYPYWIFGWNYVTADKQSFTPFLINDQQFVHSLASLGVNVNGFDYEKSIAWRDAHMKDTAGYQRVKAMLAVTPECEPLQTEFPHMPRLCKRWWDPDILTKHPTVSVQTKPAYFAGTVKAAVKWITPIYGHPPK